MPSYASGLASALARGIGGYATGEEIGSRDLINEIAKRQAGQRADEELQLKKDELQARRDQANAKLVTQGYTPASTSITTEPSDPATAAPAPSFRDFLTHGLGTTAAPVTAPGGIPLVTGNGSATPADGSPTDGPPAEASALSLTTPITAGSLGTLPKLKVTDTPASFDPMAGTQGSLEAAREAARAGRLTATLDSREAVAEANRKSRVLIAQVRAANGGAAGGSRPMTANAKETNARQAAKALLVIHQDDPDALKAWLAGPDGADARAQGITPFHVDLAAGLVRDADTKTAIGFSKGMKPERAVQRVKDTRAAAQAASLPPLTQAQKDRAASQPDYAAFLKSKGYPY